jgi:hypothetical protein
MISINFATVNITIMLTCSTQSLSTATAAASLATMASGSATARRDGNEGDLHNRNTGYVNNNALGGMMHPHNMSNGEFAVPNLNTPTLSMNQNAQLPNNGRPNIPQHDGANDELSIEVLFGKFLLQLGLVYLTWQQFLLFNRKLTIDLKHL